MQNIRNCEIRNPKDQLDLFLTALEQMPVEAMANFLRFDFCSGNYYELGIIFKAIAGYGDFEFVQSYLDEFINKQGWTGLKGVVEEHIFKIKDPELKKTILTWFTHFLGRCLLEKISPASIDYLINQRIIERLLVYRDPLTRYSLTLAMLDLVNNEEAKLYFEEVFQTFVKNTPKTKLEDVPKHAVLPLLILSLTRSSGVSKEVCDAHFKQVCSSFQEGADTHSFKDGKYLQIYVNAMILILKSTELQISDKEFLLEKLLKEYLLCKEMESFAIDGNVLNRIMDTEEIDSMTKESLIDEIFKDYLFSYGFEEPKPALIPFLRAIPAINELGKISNLKKQNLESFSFSDILQTSFQSVVPVKPIANFSELFLEHLENAREPNYIIIYAAKLATLTGSEKTDALGCLASCVEGLLEGTFLKKRYDLEASLHLKTVFGNNPELLKEWKKGEKLDFVEFLKECDPENSGIDFRQFFNFKIINDKHLNPELVPHLRDLLLGEKTLGNAKADIETEIQTCSPNSEKFSLLSIQANCIALMDDKLTVQAKKSLVTKISSDLKNLQNADEFRNDLRAISQGLQNQSQLEESYEGYTIEDTDDFEDLFLSGTEVPGSCQRIDAAVVNNKCLMAIVLDGKNRLLEIKNKERKIVARNIIRIMPDGTTSVLFLERNYPFLVPKFSNALEAFAKVRAEKLGLTLLSKEVGKGPAFPRQVQSLGSLAPFEYTDAGGGVTDGIFPITGAHILYEAPKKKESVLGEMI